MSTNASTTANDVTTSVEHPGLVETDALSIRVFLREYYQYAKEVTQPAKQLVDNATAAEVVTPVNLKYCVDAEWFETLISLEFIEYSRSYNDVTDEIVRAYLDKEAKTSKTVVTMTTLDEIVDKQLRINMNDANAPRATKRLQSVMCFRQFAPHH